MEDLRNPFRRTPFRDTAQAISKRQDYVEMSVNSDRARSHAWWKKLVDVGAWGGDAGRVGPPDPESLDGIAKLFGTTREQVAEMVAADWYGVVPTSQPSALVMRLAPLVDALSEGDATLVEHLIRRLSST